MYNYLLTMLLFLLLHTGVAAQDSTLQKAVALPEKLFSRAEKEVTVLSRLIDRKTSRWLIRLERQEKKIIRKMMRLNPEKAKAFASGGSNALYQLNSRDALPSGGHAAEYLGRLDSLSSLTAFLKPNSQLTEGAAIKVDALTVKLDVFKTQLNQTERIKTLVRERQEKLKALVQNSPLGRQYKKFQKQYYYYSRQMEEYKNLFKDPSRLEQKAFELLSQTKAFKEFFARNSQLASLFNIPGAISGPNAALAPGLQTQAATMGQLRNQFGGGPNVNSQMQQSLATAQNQLNELKNKIAAAGSKGDMDMPDFKPNGQKTKSFWKRWQLGTNIQSTRGSRYFPLTTDLGLSAGYKLNDKSIIGIGGSYKLGLGSGWNDIRLSQQGASLRSFIDYKIKGGFWLSGGYENNFRTNLLTPLSGATLRQESALLGLSKKYTIGKKLKGQAGLLYDFLHKTAKPAGQPLVFRLGYSFQ